MVSVKFIKPWSAYSPGDIAGFDEKRAKSLVDAGAAKLYDAVAGADAATSGPEHPADAASATEVAESKPGRRKK